MLLPSNSAKTVYGKKHFSGRCCTSTFSSPEGANVSFYIKDLLRGCIDVSRQLSLISNALFLTFTTMCHYEKRPRLLRSDISALSVIYCINITSWKWRPISFYLLWKLYKINRWMKQTHWFLHIKINNGWAFKLKQQHFRSGYAKIHTIKVMLLWDLDLAYCDLIFSRYILTVESRI